MSTSASAWAQVSQAPAPIQATILARALSYDKELTQRAGKELLVAVVYRGGDFESERQSRSLFEAFDGAQASVQNMRLRARRFAFHERFEQQLRDEGIDAVYLCTGLDSELAAITAATRAVKVISMTGQEPYVRAGVSLGLVLKNGKPAVHLNLKASQEEGASLAWDFVRIATVVQKP